MSRRVGRVTRQDLEPQGLPYDGVANTSFDTSYQTDKGADVNQVTINDKGQIVPYTDPKIKYEALLFILGITLGYLAASN